MHLHTQSHSRTLSLTGILTHTLIHSLTHTHSHTHTTHSHTRTHPYTHSPTLPLTPCHKRSHTPSHTPTHPLTQYTQYTPSHTLFHSRSNIHLSIQPRFTTAGWPSHNPQGGPFYCHQRRMSCVHHRPTRRRGIRLCHRRDCIGYKYRNNRG